MSYVYRACPVECEAYSSGVKPEKCFTGELGALRRRPFLTLIECREVPYSHKKPHRAVGVYLDKSQMET